MGGADGGASPARPVSWTLYAYFLVLAAAAYGLVRSREWRRLGATALAAAFLAPVLVAGGATPNPPAALLYFLIVTAATLLMAAVAPLARLAWVALFGGLLLGPAAGATGMGLPGRPVHLVELGYFAVVVLGATAVAARHRRPGLAVTALLGGVVVGSLNLPPAPGLRELFPAFMLYLIVLGSAALYAAVRSGWRWVEWAAVVATGLAALDVAGRAMRTGDVGPSLAVTALSVAFLVFSLAGALASRGRPEVRMVTVVLAAGVYGAGLVAHLQTRDQQAWPRWPWPPTTWSWREGCFGAGIRRSACWCRRGSPSPSSRLPCPSGSGERPSRWRGRWRRRCWRGRRDGCRTAGRPRHAEPGVHRGAAVGLVHRLRPCPGGHGGAADHSGPALDGHRAAGPDRREGLPARPRPGRGPLPHPLPPRPGGAAGGGLVRVRALPLAPHTALPPEGSPG